MNQTCKIVTYHYVRPIKNSKFPNVKGLELDGFSRQIDYFKKHFKIISQDEIIEHIYENKTFPSHSLLLTFDDGLKDHFQFVFPELKKHGISGVFFPPSLPIEENIVLDVHKIHFILESVSDPSKIIKEIKLFFEDSLNEIGSFKQIYSKLATFDRFDSPDIVFIKKLLQRELPIKKRNELTSNLFSTFVTTDEKSFSNELYLTKNEILEMLEENMEFGSHSYSHEWLSFLPDLELKNELSKSKIFLKQLGVNNLTISYPYGNYNEKVENESKKLNFKLGYTTEIGDTVLSESGAFSLQRFDTNDFPQ